MIGEDFMEILDGYSQHHGYFPRGCTELKKPDHMKINSVKSLFVTGEFPKVVEIWKKDVTVILEKTRQIHRVSFDPFTTTVANLVELVTKRLAFPAILQPYLKIDGNLVSLYHTGIIANEMSEQECIILQQ